jgi:hypothetical protein
MPDKRGSILSGPGLRIKDSKNRKSITFANRNSQSGRHKKQFTKHDRKHEYKPDENSITVVDDNAECNSNKNQLTVRNSKLHSNRDGECNSNKNQLTVRNSKLHSGSEWEFNSNRDCNCDSRSVAFSHRSSESNSDKK